MAKLIRIIRNYRITEIAQLQMVVFWITLAIVSGLLFYLIWNM